MQMGEPSQMLSWRQRRTLVPSHSHSCTDCPRTCLRRISACGRPVTPCTWSRWRHTHRMSCSRPTKAICLLVLVLVSALLPAPAMACGPGRGANRRRSPRKLTPLVFKQHVPNVSENTLGASGLTEGKITRDDPRFQELVPNYNSDIVFKDEEGTGADRLMTQRCKEKLNTLAISVMNQWPGVKLRVTEGWDEEGLHAANSLHYEGRAVDITTSDRDRSKYGMLARLAVEAGFDWVYYESRAHIHASVKSESSQAARHGGCFPPDATVQTEDGHTKKLVDLERGEKVRAMDSDGQLVYSEVLLFLDRSSDEERDFVVLKAEDGSQITLTASHLIYTVSAEDLQEDMDLNEEENWQSNSIDDEDRQMAKRLKELNVTVSNDLLRSRLKATFAYKAQIGDWIVVTDASGRAQPQRIVDVSVVHKRGVYAPLTSQGTLVVDNVVVSCYAVIDDQSLAHWAFAPIRILNNIQSSMVHFWKSFSGSVRWWRYHQGTTVSPVRYEARSSTDAPAGSAPVGIHWYAKFLYRIAKYILPSHLVYN